MTLLCVCLLLCSCAHNNVATNKPHPYLGPTQPMADVVDAINQNNRKLPTLWASIASNGLEASIVDDHGKRHNEVLGGTVLYRAPQEVLLVGRHDVAGVVVLLGSNKENYWLIAKDPGPDTAWWGRYKYLGKECAQPIPIRPDLVMEVLGVGAINTNFNEMPVPVMRFNNDADAYMFVWHRHLPDRWYAVKEVWYDRQTKLPKLVLLFDADGRVLLRAYLAQHRTVQLENTPKEQWPRVATDYRLYFPDSGSKLHIRLDDVRLSYKNKPDDRSFNFNPRTAGVSKVIQLDEACGP